MKRLSILLALAGLSMSALAQRPNPNPAPGRPVAPGASTGPTTPATPAFQQPKTGPKAFKEVITEKAQTMKGLFTVHRVEDKYYFEIPDTLLNREIMAVTRFSRVAGGGGVYGGELANQQTLIFEKGPNNNFFVRVVTTISVADTTNDIFQAVTNSNLNPIAAAFDVKAYGKDSTSTVIEVTDWFRGDNQIVSASPSAKRRLNLSSIAPDRSYVQSIRPYPINVEVKTVKTFNSASSMGFGAPSIPGAPTPLPAANAAGAVTLEMNTSFIILPRVPMQRRFYDPRVGFFADDYVRYGDDQQKVNNEVFAVRWRLQPKPADMEKYRRGELVEPEKPIIYYIDPATPKKWRRYLIMGVNDWQKAFEKAGFKNAIMAKEIAPGDSISFEDSRYSFIRYFASDIENAYGPNIHDPRSGEILESHIGWYHNVMKLLHDWYMIQAAAVDPKARTMKYDDELMGQLIRFVSSHEVGHTLGLRHNMGSSSRTPVEKLRDKAWVEANGHTASIMDYARFNYVAQPEDGITQTGLFPRIGDYDMWAIEWGYKYSFAPTEEADKMASNKEIMARLQQNPRLWFGTENNPFDPRSQTEDLGDNSMKASEYGIRNLKRVLSGLPEWTREEGDRYENMEQMYGNVTSQFSRYMGHVIKNVGGVYETPKSVEQAGDVYEPAPKEKQKEAVAFLHKQLFETPYWLIDQNLLNKFQNPVSVEQVPALQASIMANLLSVSRLNRVYAGGLRFGSATYQVDELIEDVRRGVWSELATRKATDPYRRSVQKAFVETLISNLIPASGAPAEMAGQGGRGGMISSPSKISDVSSIARGQLASLRSQLTAAVPVTTDKLTRYHYQDLADRIRVALDPK